MRRGTSTRPVLRQQAVRRGPLLRGCSARAVQHHRPTTVVASDGRVEVSPASGAVIGRWFPRSLGWRRPCSVVGSTLEGLSRLAAFAILPREGEGAAFRKENGDSEGDLDPTAESGRSQADARTGSS